MEGLPLLLLAFLALLALAEALPISKPRVRDTLHSIELLRCIWILVRVQMLSPARLILAEDILPGVVVEAYVLVILGTVDTSTPPLMWGGAAFSRTGLASIRAARLLMIDSLLGGVLLVLTEEITIDIYDNVLLLRRYDFSHVDSFPGCNLVLDILG